MDFDGVLCYERYWRSLPPVQHEQVQELLFRQDTTLVNEWMRGKYSAEQINRIVSENLGIPFGELWDIFVQDCQTMSVSEEVLRSIGRLRKQYVVILLTGNMDSFSMFTEPRLRLKQCFDIVSNSFEEGLHKTDNEGELFLKYADKFKADLRDCIAIDDSRRVHQIFSKLGGICYLVDAEHPVESYLRILLAGQA